MKAARVSIRRRAPAISRLVKADRVLAGEVGINRILVPIDFSEASRQLVGSAVALSKQFGAEIDLVHVFESHHQMLRLAGMPLVMSDSEVEHRIRHHLHAIALCHHVLLIKENIHVLKGRPFEKICQLSARIGADLIVISTRGNTRLRHFVLGSTAERVVRHASCPVLVIRPGRTKRAQSGESSNGVLSFSKIVVPIDFSDYSLKGLAYAKDLAREFGSTLVLLHCLPAPHHGLRGKHARDDRPPLMEQIEKAARDQLCELVEATSLEGIAAEPALEIGHLGQQICDRARERHANIIVTATHGHTGFKHVLLGSTAEYVVRHASCSVLVVPTRESPIHM